MYNYFITLINTKYSNLKWDFFPSFHDKIITPACFPLLFENYNDNIRLKLMEEGIFCRKYYHPLENTPNCVKMYHQILCIPCTTDMTEENINIILDIIHNSNNSDS